MRRGGRDESDGVEEEAMVGYKRRHRVFEVGIHLRKAGRNMWEERSSRRKTNDILVGILYLVLFFCYFLV